MSDEQRAGNRSGLLILRYREAESTLSRSDASTLIDAMGAWRRAERKRLVQLERDRPQALEAATRRIGRLEQLEELLAGASSHSSDATLDLNTDQANLIVKTLDELAGHQHGEITSGLSELKLALYYGI